MARRLIQRTRPDHPWYKLSDTDFYRVSGLYRKDLLAGNEGFTMAALLLFGKDEIIQSALPHYKIDALLRKLDTEHYDDRENIRCNLIDAYEKLMQFIAKHLPDSFYIEDDRRISLREIIFREIVANMLIHREYSNAFPTTLIIYNNRVETKNANKPYHYGQLNPKTVDPFPKNPHIAQLFTQMGYSEELGTGLRNVYKYSKSYSGSDHILFLEQDIFTVEVPIPHENKGVLREKGLNGGLNGGLPIEKLYQTIKENNGLNSFTLSKIIEKPQRTVEKWLAILKTNNRIEFRGSKKMGGYFIVQTNK